MSYMNKYISNVRSRCGHGNAQFISIRQVSLPAHTATLVRRRRRCCIRQFASESYLLLITGKTDREQLWQM